MHSDSIPKQVFLTHEKNDRELKKLVNALSKELQLRGFKVWTDDSISPGSEWSHEIKKALNESDAMIALLNRHSFSSSYVREELEHAFFDERYKNRLLPVLIGSLSEEDFSRLPWVLNKMPSLKIKKQKPTKKLAKEIADRFHDLLKDQGGNNDT